MARPLARDALGLGLRTRHYRELGEPWPELDYFEIISENFLREAVGPRYHLDRIRERYPNVLHGVGLNLLGPEPPSTEYLDRMAGLAERLDAPFVSDHLCWTGSQGLSHHDLLPVPHVPELVGLAAERARHVQQHLGGPFGLENLSSYVDFMASTMREWDFYAEVVERAGCWFMLDINIRPTSPRASMSRISTLKASPQCVTREEVRSRSWLTAMAWLPAAASPTTPRTVNCRSTRARAQTRARFGTASRTASGGRTHPLPVARTLRRV